MPGLSRPLDCQRVQRGNVGEIRLAHSVLPFPLVVLVTIPPVRL